MKDLFADQYQLVRSSREVLFDFCETIKPVDYTRGITFDGKSIKDLQVHVANTYQGWIMTFARKQERSDDERNYLTVGSMRGLFASIDAMVADFIAESQQNWAEEIHGDLGDKSVVLTRTMIFTHVITHEFHHKGQILMLTRGMGYIPPDTDVIRV